jgi:hypothetical protein
VAPGFPLSAGTTSGCLPRQPVDRPEALAKAADDRNAGLAKMCHLPAVHQPRAGVQQVMRLAAARRGALEEF